MMQRTDVAVDVYSDEEGPYDMTVTLPDGTLLVVDPRMLREHRTA